MFRTERRFTRLRIAITCYTIYFDPFDIAKADRESAQATDPLIQGRSPDIGRARSAPGGAVLSRTLYPAGKKTGAIRPISAGRSTATAVSARTAKPASKRTFATTFNCRSPWIIKDSAAWPHTPPGASSPEKPGGHRTNRPHGLSRFYWRKRETHRNGKMTSMETTL